MPILVIEVWRGLVQAIYTDAEELEIVVIDRDCQGAEPLQCQTLAPARLTDLPPDIENALPERSPLVWEGREREETKR